MCYTYTYYNYLHTFVYLFALSSLQVLQNELGNRAFLGELDRDSRNVVDLVERLYDVST